MCTKKEFKKHMVKGYKSLFLELPKYLFEDETEPFHQHLNTLIVKNPKHEQIEQNARTGFINVPEYLYFITDEHYLVNDGFIGIPRNYLEFNGKYLEQYYDFEIIEETNKIAQGQPLNTTRTFTPREYQKPVFEQFKQLQNQHNDITLNLATGFGKTVCALEVIMLRGVATLFVVPEKNLGEQMVNTHKMLNCECSIGFFESKHPEKLYDITIVTYNLLAQKDTEGNYIYNEHFFSNFGHTVYDEVHLAGAEEFNKALQHCTSKYRTSLTATYHRADGLQEQLRYFTGKFITVNKESLKTDVITVEVPLTIDSDSVREWSKRCVSYRDLKFWDTCQVIDRKTNKIIAGVNRELRQPKKVRDLKGNTCLTFQSDPLAKNYNVLLFKFKPLMSVSIPKLESAVAESPETLKTLIELISKLQKEGRNIIVLSTRNNILFDLQRHFNSPETALLMGQAVPEFKNYLLTRFPQEKVSNGKKMTLKERVRLNLEMIQDSLQTNLLLAVNQKGKQGLDMPHADTLIVVHPMTQHVEQAVGRIDRDYMGKAEKGLKTYVLKYGNKHLTKNLNIMLKNLSGLGHNILI